MNRFQTRRVLKTVALISTLGLAVTGLSQCRMVNDNVTGVNLGGPQGVNSRSECVQGCNDKYRAAETAEDSRHDAALRACGGDKNCKKAEDDRTKDRHKANVQAMQDCKSSCYNEGGGNGGK